jgi:hypothetical protein
MKKNLRGRTEESHEIISEEIADTIVNIWTVIYMLRDKNI